MFNQQNVTVGLFVDRNCPDCQIENHGNRGKPLHLLITITFQPSNIGKPAYWDEILEETILVNIADPGVSLGLSSLNPCFSFFLLAERTFQHISRDPIT